MPNIEIHGLSKEKALYLVTKIFFLLQDKVFKDNFYCNDLLITIFPTMVLDPNFREQPFIRLINSDQKHTEEILEELQILNVNIEHIKLEKFIPKKK